MDTQRGRTANVVIVDPDPIRRTYLSQLVKGVRGLRLSAAGPRLLEALHSPGVRKKAQIVVLNLDGQEMSSVRGWALLRLMVPGATVVGLTRGQSPYSLELALVGQAIVLLRPDADPKVICRGLRNALVGVQGWDATLLDRVKETLMLPPLKGRIAIGDLRCDLRAGLVRLEDRDIHLTDLERRVLAYLVRNPGRPVSAQEMLEAVWGCTPSSGGTRDQVWSCIRRLRRKLGDDGRRPDVIRTLGKRGYVLVNSH